MPGFRMRVRQVDLCQSELVYREGLFDMHVPQATV